MTGTGTMRGYRKPLDPRYDQPGQTMCANLAKVGEVLRRRRKELGWTVEFAAAASGVNTRTISELERGVRQVGFDTVATYAQNMGVDIVLQIRGK
jgi:plasmid maintenance system antidote protein VapI